MIPGRCHLDVTLALVTLISLAGCMSRPESLQAGSTASPPHYRATIRWTPHGIPHIKAADMGSAGYGLAYAVATDAVCVLAEEFVTVRGERARYFDGSAANIDSDAFYKALLNKNKLAAYRAANLGRVDALDAGYVAGYNRYLADHRGTLPKRCRNAAWVRPVDVDDMARLDLAFGIRYGLGHFMGIMTRTAPWATGPAAAINLPLQRGIGSNALALGRSVTASGRGILLGNPHYPWHGGSRFHLAQITVPGQFDVFNASLITTTNAAIGFNRYIAWSHTVSTAQRFTLFRLDLIPGKPMEYKVGGTIHTFRPIDVKVAVKDKDGSIHQVGRTLYMSVLGPVVENRMLPWNDEHAYVVRDVNYENYRSTDQYYDMDRARSIADLRAALARDEGVAFVNTIATDSKGHTLYADIGAIPDISRARIARCRVSPEHLGGYSIITLDGSKTGCNWRVDPKAAAPGVMPPDKEPSLINTTYVENSNDSYWLANPNQPLTGYSPIIGDEGTPRSLRTRAGLNFVEQILDKDQKFTPRVVEHLLTSNRNYGAELLLGDVLAICHHARSTADVVRACDILARWDRRQGVNSIGAQIYTEFWYAVQDKIGKYYAVPFDRKDPVHTPRGLRINDAGARKLVIGGLEQAMQWLRGAGVSPTARWGDVQFAVRNGKKVPIPGGIGASGMFSVIHAPLSKKYHGYTPIRSGNSYIQVVTWNADGTPDARIMLTYSQSPEPDSPFYDDMTRLYSKSEWIKVPFTDKQIKADLVRTVTLDSRSGGKSTL